VRVAILTESARAGDAIGNQVAEKLAFFVERGADVRVVLQSDQALHPAVRAHAHETAGANPAGTAWQFVTSADLVVVEYSQHYALLDWLPVLAGGKPRILFDYHGVTPPALWGGHNREGLENGARRRGLVWFADRALAHSRFTAHELQRQTRFPMDRVRVLGHPVDTGQFRPAAPRRDLRNLLQLGEATLLLYVGRVAVNKRVPLLVEAVARLSDAVPPVHLAVVGETRDLYEVEMRRCLQRAAELGVSERVHFLGHVSEEELLDAYRSADVFAMPSVHEGFCIPVLEAMACGVPVVAARAAALPQTVGDAGLTFIPDDAGDLCRQVHRVLSSARRPVIAPEGARPDASQPLRAAVVAFRFGTSFVGGAESSLRRMALCLHRAGHHVEVFTTCTRSEHDWSNDLAEGTTEEDGITIRRFPVDPYDRPAHLESVRAILEAEGHVSVEAERQYLRHSIHSSALLENLRQAIQSFNAVLVGPYLYGLTHDVASAFPEKTLLVPCLHDEPFSRLSIWRPSYEQVGGILYHSEEEKAFAEIELGLNHPGARCIGTWLDLDTRGDAERGRRLVNRERPYLVYCGRYSLQKDLPRLLDFARRYQQLYPDRFTFVFMGQGEIEIPKQAWTRDLGFVEEQTKLDVLAGAAALLQLSNYESLSLVTLEAWSEGTPVVANRECAVLAGLLGRAGGGRAVASFDDFAAALDDLWQRPEAWQGMGRLGQAHVRSHYGSAAEFTQTLEQTIADLATPLAQRMRRQGLARAARHDRKLWRERFGRLVEELIDGPPLAYRQQVVVVPRVASRSASVGQQAVLIPVRVANRGTHAVVADGPARGQLRCEVVDDSGQRSGALQLETSLPAVVVPGEEVAAVMRVPVPVTPGKYRALLSAVFGHPGADDHRSDPQSFFELLVHSTDGGAPATALEEPGCCGVSLQTVRAALADAEARQQLPDNYADITQGLLASWKKWIKAKLLGNFKHAYVDVLSRQQSAFNRQIVLAMQELSDCYAMLDHALQTRAANKQETPADESRARRACQDATSFAAWIESCVASGRVEDVAVFVNGLVTQRAQDHERIASLEARLERLEASLQTDRAQMFGPEDERFGWNGIEEKTSE
jgi:O-antigen biosynthesis protein